MENESFQREVFWTGFGLLKEYGLELRCENIFVKDDVLFLLVSLRNEKALFPRQSYGLGTVAPSSEARMVFTFDKLALLRGQVLRVYFYEYGGARNLVTLQRR